MWNPHIEMCGREDMRALQLKRLQWSVRHAYDNVPMYHEKMRKIGVFAIREIRRFWKQSGKGRRKDRHSRWKTSDIITA